MPITSSTSTPITVNFRRLTGPRVEGLNQFEKQHSRSGVPASFRAADFRVGTHIPDAQYAKHGRTLADALVVSHLTRILDGQGTKAIENSEALARCQYLALAEMIGPELRGQGLLGNDRVVKARLVELLRQVESPAFFTGTHAQVRARVRDMMMSSPAFKDLAADGQLGDLAERKVVQSLTNSRQRDIFRVIHGSSGKNVTTVDRHELRQLSESNVKARNVTESVEARVLCQRAFDEALSHRTEVDRMRAGNSGSFRPLRPVDLEVQSKRAFKAAIAVQLGPFTPSGLL